MGFDLDGFKNTEFRPRTKQVRVEGLAQWFDGEPLWTVRGLTSNELCRAQSAESKRKALTTIAEAIKDQGNVQAIRDAIGLTEKGTEAEIAKRLEMLAIASVDPQVTVQDALKVAEHFPVEFMSLTNEITLLTGQGSDYSKPKAVSRKTKT